MAGGSPASCGVNYWIRKIKDEEGQIKERVINLGGKNTVHMKPGERIIVCTPGGGGYGQVEEDNVDGEQQATKRPKKNDARDPTDH